MPPKDIMEPMGIYDERVDMLCSRQSNEYIQKLDKEKVSELLSTKMMNNSAALNGLVVDEYNCDYDDDMKLYAFQMGFLQAKNIILNYLENERK